MQTPDTLEPREGQQPDKVGTDYASLYKEAHPAAETDVVKAEAMAYAEDPYQTFAKALKGPEHEEQVKFLLRMAEMKGKSEAELVDKIREARQIIASKLVTSFAEVESSPDTTANVYNYFLEESPEQMQVSDVIYELSGVDRPQDWKYKRSANSEHPIRNPDRFARNITDTEFGYSVVETRSKDANGSASTQIDIVNTNNIDRGMGIARDKDGKKKNW